MPKPTEAAKAAITPEMWNDLIDCVAQILSECHIAVISTRAATEIANKLMPLRIPIPAQPSPDAEPACGTCHGIGRLNTTEGDSKPCFVCHGTGREGNGDAP